MKYIYYINGEKFTSDNVDEIPFYKISSLDENTPAFENIRTGHRFWCLKGDKWHRLNGPAYICPDGKEDFYLNDKHYENIQEWLRNHPIQDNAFQVEMLLKYT
jgi:hypothetical protein